MACGSRSQLRLPKLALESDDSVTLEDGVVIGVTATRQAEADTFLWLSGTESKIVLLALAGSLPEVNCIIFKGEDWLRGQ